MGWLFWTIIAVFVSIGIIMHIALKGGADTQYWTLGIVASLIFLAIIFPVETLRSEKKGHEVWSAPMEIVQATLNSGINGKFFLGYGTVDSKMVYHFYRKSKYTEDSSYIFDYAMAEGSTIIETSELPHIEYLIGYSLTGSSWLHDAIWGKRQVVMGRSRYNKIARIYVPKGTVIENNYKGINL